VPEPLRDLDLNGLDGEGCDLSGLDLLGGEIRELRLVRANLANLRGRDSTLEHAELLGCRMTGLEWAGGRWRDVLVADGRADLVGMRHARLVKVTFRDCVLDELDLLEARLSDVRFERCSLRGADLRGTGFERCVMHGCDLDGAHGFTSLAGIEMRWLDVVQSAGTLAAGLGVTIAEDEAAG
jgi:uncharacterized protein YjbI with pentapeptide repeats